MSFEQKDMTERDMRIQDLNVLSARCKNVFDVLVTVTEDFELQNHHRLILNSPNFKGKVLDIGSHYCVLDIVAKLKNPELDITCVDGSLWACVIGSRLAEKSKVDIKIVNALVEDTLFEEESFDTIVMCHTIEHIQDLDSLMVWVRKILKKDGTLFIVTPYKDCQKDEDHKHIFTIDDKENTLMQEVLTKNGFVGSIKLCRVDGKPYDVNAAQVLEIFVECGKK